MKNIDCRARVDAFDLERVSFIVHLADKNAFVAILRQMPGNVIYRVP